MLAYGCLLLLLRACLLLLLYCFMAVSFVIVLLLSLCREKWMLELTKVWGWTVRESKHSPLEETWLGFSEVSGYGTLCSFLLGIWIVGSIYLMSVLSVNMMCRLCLLGLVFCVLEHLGFGTVCNAIWDAHLHHNLCVASICLSLDCC